MYSHPKPQVSAPIPGGTTAPLVQGVAQDKVKQRHKKIGPAIYRCWPEKQVTVVRSRQPALTMAA